MGNTAERDKKSIGSWETHHAFTHQILDLSDRWFVFKSAETDRVIRGNSGFVFKAPKLIE